MPLFDSMPGAAELTSGGVASFDFFELFAIYFCFGSAKPLPAERECASGKGLETSSRGNSRNPNHETLCFSMGDHNRGRHCGRVCHQRDSL
jgi:hypothetical protein